MVAVHGRSYLITWSSWISHYKRELTCQRSCSLLCFLYRVSGCGLFIDARRYIWFIGRACIFAFLLLVLYSWGLSCEIWQLNFSLKYYSNGALNDRIFEVVNFGFVIDSNQWKSQIPNTTQNVRFWKSCSHSSMKRFPVNLWQDRSFLCNWEDTNFCFERFIACPPNGWWGAEIPVF